jgi:hypothetical protein
VRVGMAIDGAGEGDGMGVEGVPAEALGTAKTGKGAATGGEVIVGGGRLKLGVVPMPI